MTLLCSTEWKAKVGSISISRVACRNGAKRQSYFATFSLFANSGSPQQLLHPIPPPSQHEEKKQPTSQHEKATQPAHEKERKIPPHGFICHVSYLLHSTLYVMYHPPWEGRNIWTLFTHFFLATLNLHLQTFRILEILLFHKLTWKWKIQVLEQVWIQGRLSREHCHIFNKNFLKRKMRKQHLKRNCWHCWGNKSILGDLHAIPLTMTWEIGTINWIYICSPPTLPRRRRRGSPFCQDFFWKLWKVPKLIQFLWGQFCKRLSMKFSNFMKNGAVWKMLEWSW